MNVSKLIEQAFNNNNRVNVQTSAMNCLNVRRQLKLADKLSKTGEREFVNRELAPKILNNILRSNINVMNTLEEANKDNIDGMLEKAMKCQQQIFKYTKEPVTVDLMNLYFIYQANKLVLENNNDHGYVSERMLNLNNIIWSFNPMWGSATVYGIKKFVNRFIYKINYFRKRDHFLDLIIDAIIQKKVLSNEVISAAGEKPRNKLGLIEEFCKANCHFGFPLPETGAPELINKGEQTVNIAHLTDWSEESLTLLQSGGNSETANHLLMFQRKWLKFRKGSLFAKKGYIFRNGHIYFVDLKEHPLPLHYCANFNHIADKLIRKAKVPVPATFGASQIIQRKDLVSRLLKNNGINVPVSMTVGVFKYSEKFNPGVENPFEATAYKSYMKMAPATGYIKNLLKEKASVFMSEHDLSEAVIKPVSGSCGMGVTFVNRENTAYKIEHMRKITDNFIIEERITPPLLKYEGYDQQYDWNFRVFVSRDDNEAPKVSPPLVRIDKEGWPVNLSLGAARMNYDQLIEKLNLGADQASKLLKDIMDISLKAFTAVEEEVKGKSGKNYISSDFMGIDVIINKDFVPYILEVNDFCSGGMYDLDRVSPEEEKGLSSIDFIKTMERKALKYKRSKIV